MSHPNSLSPFNQKQPSDSHHQIQTPLHGRSSLPLLCSIFSVYWTKKSTSFFPSSMSLTINHVFHLESQHDWTSSRRLLLMVHSNQTLNFLLLTHTSSGRGDSEMQRNPEWCSQFQLLYVNSGLHLQIVFWACFQSVAAYLGFPYSCLSLYC